MLLLKGGIPKFRQLLETHNDIPPSHHTVQSNYLVKKWSTLVLLFTPKNWLVQPRVAWTFTEICRPQPSEQLSNFTWRHQKTDTKKEHWEAAWYLWKKVLACFWILFVYAFLIIYSELFLKKNVMFRVSFPPRSPRCTVEIQRVQGVHGVVRVHAGATHLGSPRKSRESVEALRV